jgi:hypothetical protein
MELMEIILIWKIGKMVLNIVILIINHIMLSNIFGMLWIKWVPIKKQDYLNLLLDLKDYLYLDLSILFVKYYRNL